MSQAPQPSEVIAALVERSGPDDGRRHPLTSGTVLIGRGDGLAISLRDDDVSRQHAEVEVQADRMTVRDLASKNGVLVAGRPIRAPHRVGHGDRFEIGGVMLEVEHPGARVGEVLARGGEAMIVTRTALGRAESGGGRGMLLPILGVAVFGALVVALLLLG